MKNLSRLIAWRYLFSSRQPFARLFVALALGGIVLGVWSLIVVLSVMKGFGDELNRRWIGLNAHLSITSSHRDELSFWQKTISSWSEVEETIKYMEGEVIVQSETNGKLLGSAAKLKGVDKIDSDFFNKVQIYPTEVVEAPVMGGEELLALLGVHPDYEKPITVIYPFGEIGPTGDWVPKQKELTVTHIFRTGIYEWDAYRLLVPFKEAENVLGEQGERGLQIRLKNIGDLNLIEDRLQALVQGRGTVASFAEQNKRLFAALRLERLAMTSFLILFGLIGSFSITGLLLLFVDAKRRDLAILRTIGLPLKGAKTLFLSLGLSLGGVGAVLGGLFGMVTCLALKRFPIQLPSSYYLDYLPIVFRPLQVGIIMGIGLALALLSSLYPVRIAGQLDPLPMLREE